MRSVVLLVALVVAAPAQAQRTVVYDTAGEGTPAAITCGFCAGEKFGVVFRELPSATTPGLRASEFPLTLNSIQIAIAAAVVDDSFTCNGSASGGEVNVALEVYAGETPPTGSILSQPETGAWPGETLVWSDAAVPLQLSVEEGGTNMYNIMINSVPVDEGVRVDPPNSYIRVVMTIPTGPSDFLCTLGGFGPPGAMAVRDDDGRIAPEVDFIWSIGGEVDRGWHWNESDEIMNPLTGSSRINGDWVIRLTVTPLGTTTPDAGTPAVDAGTDAGTDAGSTTPPMDSGVVPVVDSGTPMSMCSADADCAGGERCVGGMCQRVSCSAAADCAGGMTCVEGMCRNLCTSSSECLGGEVCDTEAGHCAPVGSEDGGCGCRTVGAPRSGAGIALVLLALGAIVMRRRR